MSTDLPLDLITADVDGALEEAHHGLTRAGFIVAGGSAIAGLAAWAACRGRSRHPGLRSRGAQLRARPGVPAGRVLHRVRALEGAQGPDRQGGGGRGRGRARARQGIPRPTREERRRPASLRFPGRDREAAGVPQDGRRLRGSRGRRLQGPGATDPLEGRAVVGAGHPHRRGTPRGLDALPQRGHPRRRGVRSSRRAARRSTRSSRRRTSSSAGHAAPSSRKPRYTG